jgi:hypothetical protein
MAANVRRGSFSTDPAGFVSRRDLWGVEDFLTKFAQAHCAVEAQQFWGWGPSEAANLRQCAPLTERAQRERTNERCGGDQTNNKQTTAAQSDLIIGRQSRCDKIAAQISEPASDG